MIEVNKIYNGNCIDVMKDIPNEFVDLIVTDPPYLINYHTNRRKNKNHDFCTSIDGDNDPQLISNYIKECYRILKNNTAMYMFCSFDYSDFFKQELEDAGFKIKNMIIWVKNNHTAGDLEAQFGKKYEIIFLVNKGRKLFNGERITDVWEFNKINGDDQLHQNQKPMDLIRQCIKKHSNRGDIVFDGFLGSGTTTAVSKEQGRKYIGIELDVDYYNISVNRTNKTLIIPEKSKSLFDNF